MKPVRHARAFRYERRDEPLLSQADFRWRLAGHGLLAALLIAVTLFAGVLGYHLTEGFAWIDALLNASMILGGMGPVDALHTVAGKLFASFYALFSGLVFIATASILVTPVAHRLLHRLHIDSPGDHTP